MKNAIQGYFLSFLPETIFVFLIVESEDLLVKKKNGILGDKIPNFFISRVLMALEDLLQSSSNQILTSRSQISIFNLNMIVFLITSQ